MPSKAILGGFVGPENGETPLTPWGVGTGVERVGAAFESRSAGFLWVFMSSVTWKYKINQIQTFKKSYINASQKLSISFFITTKIEF